MSETTSADGTTIAFHTYGTGRPVLVVGGAFSTANDGTEHARALGKAGFMGVTVDRRARGGSGDTHPYAPAREAEDLTAVIEAVGGSAAVVGHSSGAVLALYAASLGAPITALFLSEPPFHFGEDEPAADLPERLQALVDEGRAAEAVSLFQSEGIGLPPAMIEAMKQEPFYPALVQLAQSTVYDATLTRAVSTPSEAMRSVAAPIVVLLGGRTWPILQRSAERLADAIPSASLIVVEDMADHRLPADATARIVADVLG